MDFTHILLIAAGVHGAVTLIRNSNRSFTDGLPPWVWNVAAFAFGIGYAVIWSYNTFVGVAGLPPKLSGLAAATSVTGQVLSGVIIGAAAGGWHELLDFLSSLAKGAIGTPPPVT